MYKQSQFPNEKMNLVPEIVLIINLFSTIFIRHSAEFKL